MFFILVLAKGLDRDDNLASVAQRIEHFSPTEGVGRSNRPEAHIRHTKTDTSILLIVVS